MATILPTPAATGAPAAYDGFDRMLLNGRWTHGRSGQSVEDVDPYTNEVLLRIPLADQGDLDDAFEAAAAAQPAWSRARPATRAAMLRRAAAIMESRRAEIVDWLVHESGSTRIKAELEWNMARAVTLEASSFPSSAEGVMLAADIPGKESRIYRQPVGVVGMISPWNFPLHLSSRSVAPAIALGNAVVVKPASDTPVSGGLLLGKIYEEAGLPAGVLNVLIARGGTIGDAFVRHPVPRVMSVTGSTEVGRRIMDLAAESPILSACCSSSAATARAWYSRTRTSISPSAVPSSASFSIRGRSAWRSTHQPAATGAAARSHRAGTGSGSAADPRRRAAGPRASAARLRRRDQRHVRRCRGAVRAGGRRDQG